ncbi:MAG: hypothetical protein COA69_14335 [Robiginitomaculum sp.]|nr:MAG: hypothetical protein COA69_14335 [Robiginitomaculum sp.]
MRQEKLSYSREVSKASPTYFTALDGFRGVLAIMIAIYHTMWSSHLNNSQFWENGPALVDLFFVFSGFLMFTLYDGQINSRTEARAFIKRRFARIYPLHFFMLIVALLYAVARLVAHFVGLAVYEPGEILPFQAGASDTLWSFFTNLTLIHSMGVHDALTYNMPSWTVSVEFYTYFVFAAMMIWARPKKAWHFALLALAVGVNYYALSRVKPNIDFHYDLGFFRCLGGFFTGVVVAYAYRNIKPLYERVKARAHVQTFTFWASVLEAVVLAILVGFILYGSGKAQFFLAPVAFVFVLGFAFDMGLISKFLGLGLFRYVAKISYSIYMVHILFSLVFAIFIESTMPSITGPSWDTSQFAGDAFLIPYLACVLVFSHLSYHYIEMPGRKALNAYDFTSKWQRLLSLGKARQT